MHDTAMVHGKLFFDTYLANVPKPLVLDIGAQDVNGSLRSVAPPDAQYVGVDFEAGKGVDIVIDDPYVLPIETASADAVVSSSCFEHSEFFWLAFLECLRVLKPSGVFYLNVPSNGIIHRYPVDCWRFYPDSGHALQNWGRRNEYPVTLLKSFVGLQQLEQWNDLVAVFARDQAFAPQYPGRITDSFKAFTNGFVYGEEGLRQEDNVPQDQRPIPVRLREKMRRVLFGEYQ